MTERTMPNTKGDGIPVDNSAATTSRSQW